jgi:E3 ubiquitin-protein ligase RNF1/2
MTEANKQWQLNLYELHRKPLQIPAKPDKENMVTMKTTVLTDLLTCPICLDVLENTMVTKNCLHRFCSECITTALRRGNQECPTCRKKLVSRRCLRPDPNFDSLITKLFPDRKDAGDKEETDLLNLIKQHSERLHKTATERGVLVGDSSDADGNPVVKTAKGRGRKRKSTANIEKIDEVDSDGMTGLESPRDEIVKGKRAGKRTSQKKKANDSDEEADEPTPEPLKKRKRKTKKSQSMTPQNMTPQNRTPNISAQNSVRNSDNDSETDNDSTISKLSKLSKLDSKLDTKPDSKPSTPRSKKNKTPIDFTPPASGKQSIIFSSPEASETESVATNDSHSEHTHKSTDFHFILKKIDEDNDIVATELLATSFKSTIQHVREFILEKLVRINVRKYTVLVGVLREHETADNVLEDSEADASVGKIYENGFGTGEACVFGYKVVRI